MKWSAHHRQDRRQARPAWLSALCLCALSIFLPLLAADASSIVIRTETSYDAASGDIVWSISNRGDSLADGVSLHAVLPDGKTVATEKTFLDGGDEISGRLHAPLGDGLQTGLHVMPIMVDYMDGAGNAYSTIAWVRHQEGDSADATASLIQASLKPPHESDFVEVPGCGKTGGRGTLALLAMSFSDADVEARLRVLLPQGIEPDGAFPDTVTIPAQGVGYFELGITNAAMARPGVVPVAAVLDYTGGDGRLDSIDVSTTIHMVPGDDYGRDNRIPKPLPHKYAAAVFAVWALLFARRWRLGQPGRHSAGPVALAMLDFAVVAACTVILGALLKVHLIFIDALCVGGDTPAHHYLVSHIAETKRMVSWAPGWWSGFPMFRFYFPLPYAAMAILSGVVPHNIAFKLCAVAGILALPLSLYLSGRILNMARPAPAMLACLAIPIALDNTHSMWGVNAYSTLAGMIANSWSFAIMLPAIASGCRDALDRQFRWGTVILLTCVVMSHFFTSIMAAAVLLALMGMFAVQETVENFYTLRCRSWFVLFRTGLCVFLLTAWWVIPLVVRSQWAVDFGTPWDIKFFRQLPPSLPIGLLIAIVCAALAYIFAGREKVLHINVPTRLWMIAHVVLLAVSLALFYFGGMFSEVFVNCRFWPFIVYALLVVATLLFSFASRMAGIPVIGTAAMLCFCLSFAWRTTGHADDPAWSKACHVPFWAEANFRGVEALREGLVPIEIAEALSGTEGRLAHDLHPGNEWIGSSRIFEAMPYLCGKPTLEGGIVNSALGSLAAYTVQGEISDNTAGYPLIVKPRRFDPASGLRHIEFMGARHFVARSRRVQAALDADEGWRLQESFGNGKWKLYESTIESASPVRVWNKPLEAYKSESFQEDLLSWMYVRGAVAEPMILMNEAGPAPEGLELKDHAAFLDRLAEPGLAEPPAPGWLDEVSRPCEHAEISPEGTIKFTTHAIGKPHVIAASYYPDWRVDGARHVYFATPGYLVVYPTHNVVKLYHADGFAEAIGKMLTQIGVMILCASLFSRQFSCRACKIIIHKSEVPAHM